jgi:hypothetical protein
MKEFTATFRQVARVKKARCRVSNKVYEYIHHKGGEGGSMMTEIRDKRCKLFHEDVALAYHRSSSKADWWRSSLALADDVLEQAIRKVAPDLTHPESVGVTVLEINGREYLFRRDYGKHGSLMFTRFAFPMPDEKTGPLIRYRIEAKKVLDEVMTRTLERPGTEQLNNYAIHL